MAKLSARGASVLAEGRTVEVQSEWTIDSETGYYSGTYYRLRVRSDRKLLVERVVVDKYPNQNAYNRGGGYKIVGTLKDGADPQGVIRTWCKRRGLTLA